MLDFVVFASLAKFAEVGSKLLFRFIVELCLALASVTGHDKIVQNNVIYSRNTVFLADCKGFVIYFVKGF